MNGVVVEVDVVIETALVVLVTLVVVMTVVKMTVMGRECGDFGHGRFPTADVPAGLGNVGTITFGSAGFVLTVPHQSLWTRLAHSGLTFALEKPGMEFKPPGGWGVFNGFRICE